jgi:hypothetical protein
METQHNYSVSNGAAHITSSAAACTKALFILSMGVTKASIARRALSLQTAAENHPFETQPVIESSKRRS